MQMSHDLSHRTIDLCGAKCYICLVKERNAHPLFAPAPLAEGKGIGANAMEIVMKLSFISRFFRARQVYWNTLRELSAYTDRELHDLGIDRADIEQIAYQASRG